VTGCVCVWGGRGVGGLLQGWEVEGKGGRGGDRRRQGHMQLATWQVGSSRCRMLMM
jgi:hypothetical protein